jgi:hypothetical protein
MKHNLKRREFHSILFEGASAPSLSYLPCATAVSRPKTPSSACQGAPSSPEREGKVTYFGVVIIVRRNGVVIWPSGAPWHNKMHIIAEQID